MMTRHTAATLLHICALLLLLTACGRKGDSPLTPAPGTNSNDSAGTFVPTGSMSTPRLMFTSTLLHDGRVVVTGGSPAFGGVTHTAEIFDPATGSFTPTGPMNAERHNHSAVLLLDGRVMVFGGFRSGMQQENSIEIYDPATGIFTMAGALIQQKRWTPKGVVLKNGKVLIYSCDDRTTEIYDPSTRQGVMGDSLPMRYWDPESILLSNGTVMLSGGREDYDEIAKTVLYDPVSNSFGLGPTMTSPRVYHRLTSMADERILLSGGTTSRGTIKIKTAEVFDQSTARFTSTGPMTVGRAFHASSLLRDGSVVVTGGQGWDSTTGKSFDHNTAERYNPRTGRFTRITNTLSVPRYQHSSIALHDGRVLLVGGLTANRQITATAEIFVP